MDGGSENIARALLVICEQLLSERLFLSCRISRGKVGHNSDDCDGLFAKIANNTQLKHINTVGSYANLIKSSFGAEGETVVDTALILPDYYTDATLCIDPKFGCYSKGDEAVHVIESRAVPVSEHSTKGVNTMWKHYDADKYSFIVPDSAQPMGIGYIERPCKWFPEATADKPAGTQLLFKEVVPTAFVPAPFVPDSHDKFRLTYDEAKNVYTDEAILSEWERWMSEDVPSSDDAVAYKATHPDHWHNPLEKILSSEFAQHRHELVEDSAEIAVSIPFVNTVNSSHSQKQRGLWPQQRKSKSKSNVTVAVSSDVQQGSIDDVIASDDDEFNWSTDVKNRNNKPYRDAQFYIGREFIDNMDVDPRENPFVNGKFVAIVECDRVDGLHFKYYNPCTYPTVSPDEDNDEAWAYTPCKEMLRKNSKTYNWKFEVT
jgi:hypothetical protein